MIGVCPSPAGGEEYAVTFDRARQSRLLIVGGLFDEGNKLRHFTVEVMRRLDVLGIDSMLPDLPGCNESTEPLERQTLAAWRAASELAAEHFRATYQLTIRGGALVASALPGWSYAPVGGAAVLNGLLRARVIASREAGVSETRDALLVTGSQQGLSLAGYPFGAAMVAGLGDAHPAPHLVPISQADVGGGGLWLRAEPSDDAGQAQALAAIVAQGMLG